MTSKDKHASSASMIVCLLVFVLTGWGSFAHASLLHDDAIAYSVDLTTSSGNAINTSGIFTPGADVYCFDFSMFGPCPPGPLFDTEPLDNTDGDADLFLLFDAQDSAISMLIADTVVGVPEFLTGTMTFSGIGWGATGGAIVGGEVCGISFIGCGPEAGFTTEFSADAVTVGIDSFLLLFAGSSGRFSGLSHLTVDLEVTHIPAPATVPLMAAALAGLLFSRRKNRP